jgi:myosin-crossreactive antigen
MADKSISIIGAGIAGLSTGCYGQMNGYRTRIFEQHVKAGGLCTGWQRKGYTIGTSGWVAGSGPTNNDFCRFWQELGAAQRWSIVDYEEYARIEGRVPRSSSCTPTSTAWSNTCTSWLRRIRISSPRSSRP